MVALNSGRTVPQICLKIILVKIKAPSVYYPLSRISNSQQESVVPFCCPFGKGGTDFDSFICVGRRALMFLFLAG